MQEVIQGDNSSIVEPVPASENEMSDEIVVTQEGITTQDDNVVEFTPEATPTAEAEVILAPEVVEEPIIEPVVETPVIETPVEAPIETEVVEQPVEFQEVAPEETQENTDPIQ